ncbi:unnamed protein product [Phaedon cochleariae]|uniref:Uncharacterized protein n=1 Tax=Phaedon cochleariae TaxID=80249 RepID=A0A9N9SLA2_PHACE|nr:unnamed protein product [Phaedon cochleariae]
MSSHFEVGSKPWILMPDTSTGDLTKLCNHKRKIMATASLDCKPPDHVKLRRARLPTAERKLIDAIFQDWIRSMNDFLRLKGILSGYVKVLKRRVIAAQLSHG